MQLLYENMKIRVENVVDKGSVNGSDYNITDEDEVGVFNKWTDRFTSQDHPSIIQAGSFTFRFHKLLNYTYYIRKVKI